MASKAFHIELRVSNVDDNEKMLALRKALQNAGRQLHASAMLIVGTNPEPEIILFGEDFTEGKDEIALHDGEDD